MSRFSTTETTVRKITGEKALAFLEEMIESLPRGEGKLSIGYVDGEFSASVKTPGSVGGLELLEVFNRVFPDQPQGEPRDPNLGKNIDIKA